MARTEIATARSAGRLPIVVGGSGLYLKALMEGLAPIPTIPAEIRAEARAMFTRLGATAFRSELANLDPDGAARLAASDRQRLLRAYEVIRATGLPIGTWQRLGTESRATELRCATLVLMPDRKALYASIEARLDRMIAAGAVDEVRALLALGLDPQLPAMKAVGVPQLAAYLRGELGLDAACAATKCASRNYAKRQITWLRHQLGEATWFPEQFSESIWPGIRSFIRRFLLIPFASGTKWSISGPA
jgi:tRNA dimethylallyltransferase